MDSFRGWLAGHRHDVEVVVRYIGRRYPSIGDHAAEDCVQTAILKLLRSPSRVRKPFAALVTASRRLALDYIDQQHWDAKKRQAYAYEVQVAEEARPDPLPVERLEGRAYAYAKAILEGFTPADVAVLYGISVWKVYATIRKDPACVRS
jgi:DNA-directed RNA polymerase specialized sigma24 family protein